MDRFNRTTNTTFNIPPALSPLDQQSASVHQLINLTQAKTPKEQLAAFAYAWGARWNGADNAYPQAFERCKQAFLDAAGNTPESRTRFNLAVRAGIRAQLPFETSKVLGDVYS